MNELATGIWWTAPDHRTDRPVLGAIAGCNATLMVDAGASTRHAKEFLDTLATTDAPPVQHVVLTHSHWDHVFGATAIDAELIASVETRDRVAAMSTYAWDDASIDARVDAGVEIVFCRDMMKAELDASERASLRLRVPEITFETEMELDLGERIVRVIHVGGDHASDSSIVVVPGIVAFVSDCLYENLHVTPNRLTRRLMFPLLDQLQGLDVQTYILGHHDAPLSRSEFDAMAHALRVTGRAVAMHQHDNDAIKDALVELAIDADDPTASEYVTAFQAGLPHERE